MKGKIIDLTAEMYDKAPAMPMDPKMNITQHCSLETLGYNLSCVTFSTHQGTHMDVPYHFFNEGFTLSELDLGRMITPAFKIDLTRKKPGEPIDVDDVMPFSELIAQGLSPLLHTGWDKVFPEKRFFSDFPYITCNLADWLAEKKVNLIGMDMPTPNGTDWKYVHEKLLGNNVLLVEGLANMEELPSEGFTLIALPLKLRKGDGAPVRAVAVIELDDK